MRRHTCRGTTGASHRIEVDDLWLRDVLRNGTVGATDTFGRWDALSEAVSMQTLARLMCWRVVNVALLSQVDHAQDDFSIFRLSKVDILRNNWIDQIIVGVALSHELRCQNCR